MKVYKQVAQLSLTNPPDALHHDKRHRDVFRIDIPYLCTKFDDFRFSRSSDMIGAP